MASIYVRKEEGGNGLCGNAFTAPREAEFFGRRSLDAHAAQGNTKQFRQTDAHCIAVRTDLGGFTDQGKVDMSDSAAACLDPIARKFKKTG